MAGHANHDHAGHGHSPGGHSHATVTTDTNTRRLAIALVLIVSFMAVEVVAGILAHSLALLSDAAHMLTDAGAIALSLLALRLAARPAAGNLTYGLKLQPSASGRCTRCSCPRRGQRGRSLPVLFRRQ